MGESSQSNIDCLPVAMEEAEGEEVPTQVSDIPDTLHHQWQVDNSIGAADEPT